MSDDPILSALVRLEAGQAAMRGDLGRLGAGQAAMRGDLVQLEAAQAALRSDFASYRTGMLDELGATRAALMERLAEVHTTMKRLDDDVSVNLGAVDAMRTVNEATRGDMTQLREQMSVMWRQLKAVQAQVDHLRGAA